MDLQLDSGLDLSIINLHTWKKFKKPTMRKTNKTARAVTGDKMKFKGELTLPVTLNGTTKKVKVFVHKQSENLVGTDWMEHFQLWSQSINNFCHQRENSTTEAQEFKVELKENALPACKKKRKYHPRLNGQTEKFVDTLKRVRKIAQGTPNPNTPSTGSPAEIRFARKIRSAFNKLIPKQSKINTTEHVTRKRFLPGQKIFFQKNMPYWEEGMILSRIGKMVYIIQGQKHTHKRHLNQLKNGMKWILITRKMKQKNPSRLSMTHLTLNPLNTLPNNEDRRGRGNAQNPYCNTIWVARQTDDSFVCFGAKPDKGFLDLKSRRIRKW